MSRDAKALRLLSAGAAKGLLAAAAPLFAAETGAEIDGTFSAVGAIREKFVAGDACDVLILSAGPLEELMRQRRLVPGSIGTLGTVHTGIGVPAAAPLPDVATGPALAASLERAAAIYLPDPQRATAGIHFLVVLKKLGVHAAVEARLRPYPNGETAMRHLAEEGGPQAIGCTQITEIKYTAGLALVGPLPDGFGLATVYSAAVSAAAASPDMAHRLVALLTSARLRGLRADGGFEG